MSYNPGKTIKLKMNEKQARIIQSALNFYTRSFLGNLDLFHTGLCIGDILEVEKVFTKKILTEKLKDEPGFYLGIFSTDVPDEARNASDIHDVISYTMSDGIVSLRDREEQPIYQKGTLDLPILTITE